MKFKSVILVLLMCSLLNCKLFSQTIATDTAVAISCQFYLDTALKKQVYLFADQKAEFPGGEREFFKFVSQNTNFPEGNSSVNETVFVEFVIGSDGSILRKAIRRPANKLFNEAALKMLDLMPKWIPARCDGEVVPFLIRIPVNFIKR